MPSIPSQPSAKDKAPSKAGITTDQNGQRHIPASVRADGSVRKEIKIKPGYRPPEDVEVYKNRTAEAWKNRGKGGVPGADSVGSDASNSAAGSTANKNAKRREARKKAALVATGDGGVADGQEGERMKEDEEVKVDPKAEKEKQAKKLAKKLRQARELKDKKDSGSVLLPEQFEKVIRINELMRRLDLLGFDATGEKKEAAS